MFCVCGHHVEDHDWPSGVCRIPECLCDAYAEIHVDLEAAVVEWEPIEEELGNGRALLRMHRVLRRMP